MRNCAGSNEFQICRLDIGEISTVTVTGFLPEFDHSLGGTRSRNICED